MLQQQGVLNDILVWLGVIGDDGRLLMVYNQTGTIVAMTHILLPFMVLPLYSVMKTIPPSYMRAARSLGRQPVDRLLAGLRAADRARHRCWWCPRVHHRHRLLHHAGPGRRRSPGR